MVKELPDAKLHIYGDGPLRDRLHWVVEDLCLHSSVVLHGRIPNPELLRELREKIDVMVLASRRDDLGREEGLGLVLVEGAALGLPLIGTRCGGIPEVVQSPKTGLLLEQKDVDGLAEAMIRLAHWPALRRRLGQGARQLAMREFDSDQQLYKNASHYHDATPQH